MKDSTLLLLGMAIQAFVTGLLTQFNIIYPEPIQQFLVGAAIIFLIMIMTGMRLS